MFQKKIKLKNKISLISLGSWSLSNKEYKNYFYKKISQKNIFNILDKSYELGINLYDTSPAYGKSEFFIGKAFNGIKRSKILISTKVGLNNFGNKLNFKPTEIEKQISNSLKNLKTDYLDYVLIYNPKINDIYINDCYNFLVEQKKIGKIRHLGISLEKPNDFLLFDKYFKFDMIQCNFNILDNRIYDKKLYIALKKSKAIVVARSIFCSGFFSENFINSKLHLKKNDHRKLWPKDQVNSWKKGLIKIKNYSPSETIENIALRFVISENLITSALIGVRSIKELEYNIKLSNLGKLKKNFLNKIKNLNNVENFFIKEKKND